MSTTTRSTTRSTTRRARRRLRVLELGSYIVPAYAGMLLAEQGAHVTKWTLGTSDPIHALESGAHLWQWLNARKEISERHARDILDLAAHGAQIDVVLDNFRAETLDAWGIQPQTLAEQLGCAWVSMRSDVQADDARSFDMIAQMRSWAEYVGYLPFYIGDTSGGLWLAFKALALIAQRRTGHYVLGQATCMQKLVEGELLVEPPRPRERTRVPWDRDGEYYFDEQTREGVVVFKGTEQREPIRDRDWKLAHLWRDDDGRLRI